MRPFWLCCIASTIWISGCAHFQWRRATSETIHAGGADLAQAQRKFDKAIAKLDACQFDRAEEMLREVLVLDPRFGPARIALGRIYFDQKKFYLASWEFQEAATLMPNRPEPQNNLGLVMESVGRLDEAITYYETAYSLDPTNPEYLGNLLRARVRNGEPVVSLEPMINDLILIDHRAAWVDWAKSLSALDRTNYLPTSTLGGSRQDENGRFEIIETPFKEPDDGTMDYFRDVPILQPDQIEELPRSSHQ